MIDTRTATPREIEGYLSEVVRKTLGDAVQNNSTIYAKRGYFTVNIQLESNRYVDFENFRRADVKRIAKAIRALK